MSESTELGVGIHQGVPMQDYLALDAASNSRLESLRRGEGSETILSPAHLKAYLEQPQETNAAMVTGNAGHYAILEPELFEKNFGVVKDSMRRGTKAWKEMEAEWGEGYVLKQTQYDQARGMRDAVWATSTAHEILKGGNPEVTGIAHDGDGLCKIRMDYAKEESGIWVIPELKTTHDASLSGFRRTIWNQGYHRKAAWYLLVMAMLKKNVDAFTFVAVEQKPPYAVGFYDADHGMVDAGLKQVRSALAVYREAFATGNWYAYPDQRVSMSLTEYHFRQVDEERE